jgi:hypothetical protein
MGWKRFMVACMVSYIHFSWHLFLIQVFQICSIRAIRLLVASEIVVLPLVCFVFMTNSCNNKYNLLINFFFVGAFSSPMCHVHDKFRCIVLVDQRNLDFSDPPFLNRFEKQMILYRYFSHYSY